MYGNVVVATLVVVGLFYVLLTPAYLLTNLIVLGGVIGCVIVYSSPVATIGIGLLTLEIVRVIKSDLAVKCYLLKSLNTGDNHEKSNRCNFPSVLR